MATENDNARRARAGAGDEAHAGGAVQSDGIKPRPFMHRWRSGVLRAELPSTLKLVLLVLGEFAEADGTSCHPSTMRLAELAGVNEKTCRRMLQSPCAWFQRFERAGSGQAWRSYGYHLTIPKGADTTPARWREGADTMPGPSQERCGHFDPKVRTLTPEGAGTVSDDIGSEIGLEIGKEEAPARAESLSADQPVKQKRSRRTKQQGQTYAEWIQAFGEGESCLPDDHHVFRYAEQIGLPDDYLRLAWDEFHRRHSEPGSRSATKRQTDWPATFKTYVQRGFLGLWRIDRDGRYYLTDAGKQLALEVGERHLVNGSSYPSHARQEWK